MWFWRGKFPRARLGEGEERAAVLDPAGHRLGKTNPYNGCATIHSTWDKDSPRQATGAPSVGFASGSNAKMLRQRHGFIMLRTRGNNS